MARIAKATWLKFVDLVSTGTPISVACQQVGIEYAAAMRFCRGEPSSTGHAVWLDLCVGRPMWEQLRAEQAARITNLPVNAPPLTIADAIREARDVDGAAALALQSGQRFRERYFGRRTVYWQDHLWDELWTRFVTGRATGERQFVVANMPPGGGKGLALATVLPTPAGWTTIGDVKVGDTVLAPDGTPTAVTFASEVHHRPCFTVTFDDGTTVVADDEHLWPVRSRDDRKRHRPARALSTAELASRGLTVERGKRLAWSVVVADGLDLPPVELPVPPYVLGAWLGDGESVGARITKPSAELWAEIERERMIPKLSANARAASLGTHGVIFADGRSLQTELRRLGVLGRKHVPAAYLRAGRQQMLDLLHGIMDTDGYVAADGNASVDLCNERLASDLWHLLCALGVKAGAPRPSPATIEGRVVGIRWRLNFTAPFPLGRTTRITARQKAHVRPTTRLRYIASIEPVPSVPTRCIQVSHPSRCYLFGQQFAVTHNTTLVHDFSCRVIAEDRTIRIGNFSGAAALAVRNTARLRRTLERATPQRAKPVDKDRGLAIDAEATLVEDFGAFKPAARDVWNQWAFIVAQNDDEAVSEKEPTVAAFGFDQSYIGNRLDVILADDMVDKRVTRNPEVLLAQREVWDSETETRLEPGGLLLVIGQRLTADDLYHYCLQQRIPMDEEELVELGIEEEPQRYFHIVYPAHDETRCEHKHQRSEAQPWPAGCLLDPARLPWKELAAIQAKSPERYETVYQQRDSAPGTALVDPAWVHGGVDFRGEHHAPAWDTDRSVWQKPAVLTGPTTGIVTVDPSSTRYWAIHAWLYDPPDDVLGALDLAGKRYLLDLANTKMEAPELLGYNLATRQFYGVLEQWWQNYKAIGQRLDAVVVEHNHAQRFLLQYDHARTWSTLRGVQFVPHNTAGNKLDPDVGVTSIAEHWRFGRVRLPGRTDADRIAVDPLVRQVTTWPKATLDDQVMANWFMEIQLPNLAKKVRSTSPTQSQHRPSWLNSLVGSRR